MIALNEILKNKNRYLNTYQSMGKNIKLDKIVNLEEKFIIIDDRKNTNRAKCNKLCSQVADIINNGDTPKNLINQINQLDRQISRDELKSKRAMKKINKLLAKLPNIPCSNNLFHLVLKSKNDKVFKFNDFKNEISKITKPNYESQIKLKQFKNRVLKLENLPQQLHFEKRNSLDIIFLLDTNANIIFDNLTSLLVNNASFVIEKSINKLNKASAKEIIATLSDNAKVSMQFIGEYLSRDLSLKYYDKSLDMTRFINIIKINIKRHG